MSVVRAGNCAAEVPEVGQASETRVWKPMVGAVTS